jgi:hypothetical protein
LPALVDVGIDTTQEQAMAHTQRNRPRTPSAAGGDNDREDAQRPESQENPKRGQGNKVTNSPRKRAPQAVAGKRHE